MANAYQKAGVNIEAGYEAVEKIKKHTKRTLRAGVMGQLGGFGGVFDLSELNLKEPVLVSGTDGVGTKLKLAFMVDRHDTIGIDCVAMCVNDIVVQGAEPIYFLDYVALGKAVPDKIEQIVSGIADGCEQAGCALIGGETAEMPGLYEEDEYDLAGFAVGACEKSQIITGEHIHEGDVLIGLASSGIHSNGYSLVRKVFLENQGFSLDVKLPELSLSLGDELLKPTKIYVKSILAALQEFEIKGMSHITGGGFIENLPRMLPEGFGVIIEKGTWPVLPIFKALEKYGDINENEMYNIFNMGIGFVVAVRAEDAESAIRFFVEHGEKAYKIGSVVKNDGVTFVNAGTIK
ncbi:phosphoribosylformylglycinamidine cyclo-ligase [Lederbergia wuyishanensis]|uniref:Phosphoribosylformylglycinamidine cyclo-ligase n=1 Tax=Lederbergia wuyishanensis TaxID=1347903 RepID=A0ABU0D4S4_9BACI|nr:phosphoribosylformylglycinamidine cyclo-ligase [Lederbergia wuyishanensis]MCJ8008026.1 phosphoribosylformylglycinamidine cyclo-ligase [Lederbergia wuyishanensis]MDQ0343390.1 phosphoribosylformylglycinamidine cyclo-ligase [Lederbergia wuyishanensis]